MKLEMYQKPHFKCQNPITQLHVLCHYTYCVTTRIVSLHVLCRSEVCLLLLDGEQQSNDWSKELSKQGQLSSK